MNITGECNNQTHATSHSKTANKKGNKMSLPGQKLTDRFKNSTFALLNYLLIFYGWSHQPTKLIFKDLVSGDQQGQYFCRKKSTHTLIFLEEPSGLCRRKCYRFS